ncbi:MAG TPA: thioredoxin-disulfide reductase [Planctomycetaceae bacterium]|nr:thioredoxin-disulfide reductase [Planctomycetaceae bacterium]
MEKLIIIGSGPAAWTAAIYASRASLEPLVIEGAVSSENQARNALPMGQLALTTEVENFPGFPPGDLSRFLETSIPKNREMMMPPHEPGQRGVSGPELVELIRAQAVHFGTRVTGGDIVEVDFDKRPYTLKSSDGKTYETRTVIVATGAGANWLGLESETRFKNKGVSACAVCDGALPRFRNKEIAVVGGGDSAVEEADYLSRYASKVYLVHRRDQLRASKILAEKAKNHPKIEILWNHLPVEIRGNEKEGVTGILLENTRDSSHREQAVAGVFLAIGHTPNTGFLKGKIDLDAKGFVVRPVPFRTDTSVPGVFAAGDVADDRYRQAITAAGTGCMAALDAERFLVTTDVTTE